jgi:hypothetical protein
MLQRADDLYRKINNLLSMLRSSYAVERVDEYYMKFNNQAPAQLLQEYIDELQDELDNAQ